MVRALPLGPFIDVPCQQIGADGETGTQRATEVLTFFAVQGVAVDENRVLGVALAFFDSHLDAEHRIQTRFAMQHVQACLDELCFTGDPLPVGSLLRLISAFGLPGRDCVLITGAARDGALVFTTKGFSVSHGDISRSKSLEGLRVELKKRGTTDTSF